MEGKCKGESMSKIKELIRKVFWVNGLLSIFLCVGILSGCATSKTTHKETTVRDNNPGTTTTTTVIQNNDETPTRVTTTTTKTNFTGKDTVVKEETTTKKSEGGGVIGSFFHFVGQVIAFPFKVIGGILGAIF